MKKFILSCGCLVLGAGCHAAGNNYGDSTAAYKNEVKGDDLSVVNVGFAGDIAGSQAKRSARNIPGANDGEEPDARLAGRGPLVGSGINFASPTIYGTVRGDVTIIVGRFGNRGSITSIQR